VHAPRAEAIRRRSAKGQSLVELSLVLPILVGILGGSIDFARIYQASIILQSATRNAAEAAASEATTLAEAEAIAREIVCVESQHLTGFVPGMGGDVATCTAPAVTVTFTSSESAPGAAPGYPLASATVRVSLEFAMLVAWPLLPGGSWTLDPSQSYSIVQNR
jgi:Flp pilus assembly protein TadG